MKVKTCVPLRWIESEKRWVVDLSLPAEEKIYDLQEMFTSKEEKWDKL